MRRWEIFGGIEFPTDEDVLIENLPDVRDINRVLESFGDCAIGRPD